MVPSCTLTSALFWQGAYGSCWQQDGTQMLKGHPGISDPDKLSCGTALGCVGPGLTSWPSLPLLCPHRPQGTCPPPPSTLRTAERTSFLQWWVPQHLILCQLMCSSDPMISTPNLALHWLLPQLSSAALPQYQPLLQIHPRTLGPPNHTGLKPSTVWPLWAQVSPILVNLVI